MNIAIVTSGGLPVPNVKGGGAETLITALLKENEKSDNNITVYSIDDEEARKEAKNYKRTQFIFFPYSKRTISDRVRCRAFTDFPRETPMSFSKIAKDIGKEEYDKIIIEHTPWQFPYFVSKFGNKVSLHLHNDWVNNDWEKKYADRFRNAINNSSGVITISKYMQDRVKTIEGIDSSKVKLLYNATDTETFGQNLSDKEKKELRESLHIKNEDMVLIYTGRLCKDKGVLELLEAFEQVISGYDNVKLLIVGSVSYGETTTDEYTNMVAKKVEKYQDRIILTGFVPYKDMYKYYNIADVQIIPSMWEEPFGLVAIEGMSQGLAVICSDSGGLVEVVDDDCAIVVKRENIVDDLKRAIVKLLEDPKLRARLGVSAKEHINNHREYSYSEYYKKFIYLL